MVQRAMFPDAAAVLGAVRWTSIRRVLKVWVPRLGLGLVSYCEDRCVRGEKKGRGMDTWTMHVARKPRQN